MKLFNYKLSELFIKYHKTCDYRI